VISFLKKLPRNLLFWFINGVKWVFVNVFRGLIWILKDIYRKKIRIILAIGLAIGAYFLWGLSSSLLWGLFLVFLFCNWDSRVIASLALISLSSCPVLLQMKQDKIAEEMAVYAYFFLVMTVVLQIVEYIREGREEKKRKKEEVIPKKEPLLLSEKIELLIGDPDSFVREVERAEKKKEKEIEENGYLFIDKDEDGEVGEGELMKIETVEIIKDEKEENEVSMKIGLKDKTVLRSTKVLMVTVKSSDRKKRVGKASKRKIKKEKIDPDKE
jgi:hypothetical protein